jgi:DNA-binding PadR family transcriptional regulator
LSRRNNVVNGKVRKYYRITEKGVNALEEAKPKIKELVDEVL